MLMKQKPEVYFEAKFWFTCRVRILIVIDDPISGGFGPTGGFHLGQVLEILDTDPWWHVTFEVTRAHRQTSATADIENFRFDAHDLSTYSQVWLFGIERTDGALTPAELRALSQFMDGGGGVFATGDHENLAVPNTTLIKPLEERERRPEGDRPCVEKLHLQGLDGSLRRIYCIYLTPMQGFRLEKGDFLVSGRSHILTSPDLRPPLPSLAEVGVTDTLL
jgi:hypothetical protein